MSIHNLMTDTVIVSNRECSSSYYSNVSFSCSAGDVIEIAACRYNTSYTSYLYFCFDGFESAPISTAEADCS